MRKSVLILKAGSKPASLAGFPGDYEDWIVRGMGLQRNAVEVVTPSAGDRLPPPVRVAGVVVTGSAAMVTEWAPWMVASAEWLHQAASSGIAILGICFGHQLLAQAFGGRVDDNPQGVEVGTVEVRLTGAATSDPLFSALPPSFSAHVTHRQTILELPQGSTRLAVSELDGCQAFRCGERAWGIQFHPEFEPAMMPLYIDYWQTALRAAGRSPEALRRGVTAALRSATVLPRFARLTGAVQAL